MYQKELKQMQEMESNPSLTITLPMHRTSPDNKRDPIRLRNLISQATNRLLDEYGRRAASPLLERLDQLVMSIDYRYSLDGLAIFVNSDFASAIHLPFTLNERVHLGETFLTRDLVFAQNRTPRYWTLVLSTKPARLYESTRDDLEEIQTDDFPLVHEGPGGEAALPGGFGIRRSAYRDEYLRKFFRQVDDALRQILAEEPLPVVLVGVDRNLAFFNEVSSLKDEILATLQGNYDETTPSALGDLVWPLAKEALAAQRAQVLEELEKAVGERRSASTIGEVWRLARAGQGHVLLVEENYHYPAVVDESGWLLEPAKVEPGDADYQDAVDEIIETVLRANGKIVFFEDGQLAKHQRIALILRY